MNIFHLFRKHPISDADKKLIANIRALKTIRPVGRGVAIDASSASHPNLSFFSPSSRREVALSLRFAD